MMAQKELIKNYVNFSKPKQVRLGDGRVVVALGSGDFDLMHYVNGEIRTATMTNVLFVPRLVANLFSVKAVVAKGYTAEFTGDCCYIKKRDNIHAIAKLGKHLYILECEPKKNEECAAPAMSDVNKEKFQLWHTRLGHIGERKLNQLAKSGALGSLKMTSGGLGFCGGGVCLSFGHQP